MVSLAAMKKALSLLLAFMFIQTQTWALSGGPVYATTPTGDLTGGYTGAFVAKSIKAGPGVVIAPLTPTGMGVFSLLVPVQGPATGTTVFFQGNVTYSGTIIGAANSSNRTLTGIIDATSTSLFVISAAIPAVPDDPATPGNEEEDFVDAETTALFAQGSLQTKVSGGSSPNTGNQAVNGVQRSASAGGLDANGNPVALGQAGDRLSGTAKITAQFLDSRNTGVPAIANLTTYSVSGVRQTNVVTAAAAGGGGGGGGGGGIFP
jgi:hypothetical protein